VGKEGGLIARVGDASCLGGKDSTNLVGFDVCCAQGNGLLGSELVLCTREEPFVCEPLSCPPSVFAKPECSGPTTSSWVLQKVKDIHHFVGLSCELRGTNGVVYNH
jgi:hypothetical protein